MIRTVIGKLVVIDDNLFFKDENTLLEVKNVTSNNKGFFQISGWYVYKEPLDLTYDYEIDILDKDCHIIRKYERKST